MRTPEAPSSSAGAFQPAPEPQVPQPSESSIIVDASMLAPQAPPPPPAAAEPAESADGVQAVGAFIREMVVLIKYGHRDQVPGEIDRWAQQHPSDLVAHFRLAE